MPEVMGLIAFAKDGWTCADSGLNGEFGYSIQLNIFSKSYWFQNAIQQNLSSLVWNMQVWTADQVTQLHRWPILEIPQFGKNWRPNTKTLQILKYNTDTQEAIAEIQEGGAEVWGSVRPTGEFKILPRVVDLTVGGYGGGSISDFSGFVANASIHTGVLRGANYYDFKVSHAEHWPKKFANVWWSPTQEASNLMQRKPALGSQNLAFVIE